MIYTVMLTSPLGFAPTSRLPASRFLARQESQVQMLDSAVVIGVAADSGCGKSTFMRRLTSIFGGESKCLPIGRKSNTEWPDGITALHEACQNWDKMAADVTDLKAGKTVSKPIYNHITGELDPVEEVPPTPIVIFEGLHPMHDDRVNEALDLTVYLDITDDVKFAWKAQRDIAERGATMDEVQAAIDARKPDFAAYVEPQKSKADIVIQVLMSEVVPDGSGKFLKVKFIQKKDCKVLDAAYLMDEGSAISWTPNTEKLASKVGVKLASYSDEWFGQPVSVVEMDGAVDKLEEIIYLESQLCNSGTKYYGELTEQIVQNKDAPSSDNGTGLMQTLCSFKIREAYEKLTAA